MRNKSKIGIIYFIKSLIFSLLIFFTGYIAVELEKCIDEKVMTSKMLVSVIIWVTIYLIYIILNKKLDLKNYKKSFKSYLLFTFSFIVVYGIAFVIMYVLYK